MTTRNYNIQITVDPGRAQAGAAAVRRSLEQVEARSNSLERSLRRAFAGAGLTLAINGLVKVADAYTTIGNRLRTVTSSTEQLGAVQAELFAIAQRTRQAFGEVAETYARTAASAKDLGVSQRQVLQFTESLGHAIALSGASAAEASAAMRQLSQALSSGLLRNEELNSILEQLPVVADVIAKSMGVARGELRRLAEQGRITAGIVVEAFARARGELADRFAASIPTISSAFTQVGNSLSRLVGMLDELTGFSRTVISWLQSVSKALDSIKREDVVDFLVESLLPIVELLTAAFKALSAAAGSLGMLTMQSAFQDAQLGLLGVQRGLLQSSVDARRRARAEEAAAAPGGPLDQAGAARPTVTREMERRAELMRQLTSELDKEYRLLGLNREQQEILNQLHQIEERFIRNKTPLNAAETDAIRQRLEQLQQLKRTMGVVEDAATAVFGGMESAIVRLVETGKLSFKEMADAIVADLVRIALRAFVTNQLISAVTGWAGGMLAPAQPKLPAYSHAQARFATGGSFVVPGAGGTDSRMVAFRATPGERVTVSRPDQGGSSSTGRGPVQQVNVYNNARGAEAETRERTVGGTSYVDVIISTVKEGLGRGEFDSEMGGSFGVRRGVRRR